MQRGEWYEYDADRARFLAVGVWGSSLWFQALSSSNPILLVNIVLCMFGYSMYFSASLLKHLKHYAMRAVNFILVVHHKNKINCVYFVKKRLKRVCFVFESSD